MPPQHAPAPHFGASPPKRVARTDAANDAHVLRIYLDSPAAPDRGCGHPFRVRHYGTDPTQTPMRSKPSRVFQLPPRANLKEPTCWKFCYYPHRRMSSTIMRAGFPFFLVPAPTQACETWQLGTVQAADAGGAVAGIWRRSGRFGMEFRRRFQTGRPAHGRTF